MVKAHNKCNKNNFLRWTPFNLVPARKIFHNLRQCVRSPRWSYLDIWLHFQPLQDEVHRGMNMSRFSTSRGTNPGSRHLHRHMGSWWQRLIENEITPKKQQRNKNKNKNKRIRNREVIYNNISHLYNSTLSSSLLTNPSTRLDSFNVKYLPVASYKWP